MSAKEQIINSNVFILTKLNTISLASKENDCKRCTVQAAFIQSSMNYFH